MKLRYILAAATAPTTNTLSNAPGVDITIGSLYAILYGLVCWGSRFLMIIMVIMILWYGAQMLTAGGNDQAFGKAKKSLTYAVIGVAVIMGAYTIIATVANTIQTVPQISQGSSPHLANWSYFVPVNCSSYSVQ